MTTDLAKGAASAAWTAPAADAALDDNHVHVWRIPLDNARADGALHASLHALLSADEQARAMRLLHPVHRTRFIIAHAALRRILGRYSQRNAMQLEFGTGAHGKPHLVDGGRDGGRPLHFNLAHSGDVALVAVSAHGAVGIDVEQWRDTVQCLAVADRFFSAAEQRELNAFSGNAVALTRGFFTLWSRKEAYLKATGHGIARGLDHFDVSLEGDGPARILEDRLDAAAPDRWTMTHLDAGPGYSAALVAEAPVAAVRCFDAATL